MPNNPSNSRVLLCHRAVPFDPILMICLPSSTYNVPICILEFIKQPFLSNNVPHTPVVAALLSEQIIYSVQQNCGLLASPRAAAEFIRRRPRPVHCCLQAVACHSKRPKILHFQYNRPIYLFLAVVKSWGSLK